MSISNSISIIDMGGFIEIQISGSLYRIFPAFLECKYTVHSIMDRKIYGKLSIIHCYATKFNESQKVQIDCMP